MKFEIKNAGRKGRGVFAKRLIRKGEPILRFEGQRHTWSVIAKHIKVGLVRPDDPFQISEEYFLQLDPTATANHFNHSCNPNAGFHSGRQLVALHDIRAGEEICFDYSTVVCRHCSWHMNCACGSAQCRKRIGPVSSIPRKKLLEYRNARALPAFIERELK